MLQERFDAGRGTATSQETPEMACDVTGRVLSFECRSIQIGEHIMTGCKLLVTAAMFTIPVGGAGMVSAYTGEELAKDAKVTLAGARAIALKAFPGKIADEELEKEKGGSGLRYSFDIKNGSLTHTKSVSMPRPASCSRTASKVHTPIEVAQNRCFGAIKTIHPGANESDAARLQSEPRLQNGFDLNRCAA